ncbi:MAG: FtsX-like permease family protein [Planctomycetota bacterium]|nr:FtsX-like permease family protein [Planctomycetota bacterium]
MYKLVLCWRYLKTRYLALVCVVSVMLGVATLIVVNSVMGGFSAKLRDRLHGLLSDVMLEAYDYDGFTDAEGKMELIRKDPYLAEQVVAMAPTLEIFAMLQFSYRDMPITKPVRVVGIRPEERALVGGFAEHLTDPARRAKPSFELDDAAKARLELSRKAEPLVFQPLLGPDEPPPPDPPDRQPHVAVGAIPGYAIAHFRDREARSEDGTLRDRRTLQPGDEIIITTVSGAKLAPVFDRFVIADYFKSEMSEYDSQYVFVPLDHLQKLRTMEGKVTSIQIRLKDYDQAPKVVARLKELFRRQPLEVQTWEDKQGNVLAAIRTEKGILNILLFLIIAVAGFGILAIFSMIVGEKTRDIGILKSLGASNWGVMQIFLGYGLLLGIVGGGLGSLMGLAITTNINQIEHLLAKATGQDIFPRDVYYFDRIPTDIQPSAILLVNLGAVAIAVLFSILPALRASMLHPVRALRFE